MHAEETDGVLTTIKSKYEFKSKVLEYSTHFCLDKFVVMHKDRLMGEIPYESILKIEKRKKGLKFEISGGSCLRIPCESEKKNKIFQMFKNKRSGAILNRNDIVGVAFVQFADLKFLVPLEGSSFNNFKRSVIRRIGGHFLPSQSLDFVSLEHYNEFVLYIIYNDAYVMLESDDDFVCALMYFDNKLNVIVKHASNQA
ncbi:hypothetical protein CWI42_110440 [Ordospora colligata]|uniref:Uncharacterized protein n=1 Tax=Ordospora colligata OC4 TaxID=1354746 RepID=A0A0B2UIE3_9MICR|nr:uncharacterized protein M896_110440 [Ordospora colligata OC4]KHN69014.1 hypothetical protein M896_110440 [Ordospora colligata OC4]TBU14242.1 hypothetical protein CWI40_110440 [Ordospora colligata]TBU14289.1 hypothetical protein CWI41_110440 [Ordospora colligata]TBU17919.1 hypothetical protein CWI42_110440 [Ordospora colligata]